MRDTEQKLVFHEFPLTDAYWYFDRPASARATWLLPSNPSVKCRFDRVYINNGNIAFTKFKKGPNGIQILGRKALTFIGKTPSDHFGMVTVVKVWSSTPSPAPTADRGATGVSAHSERQKDTIERATSSTTSSSSSTTNKNAIQESHQSIPPREAMRKAAIARQQARKMKRKAVVLKATTEADGHSKELTIKDAVDGNTKAINALEEQKRKSRRVNDAPHKQHYDDAATVQQKTPSPKSFGEDDIIDLT